MTKRKKPKLPGLYPALTYKHQRWAHDQDYIDKLSPEEKAWLSKFNAEYHQNTFQRDGTDLHTDEQRRAIYNKTNASYRDVMHQWDREDLLSVENQEDKDEEK